MPACHLLPDATRCSFKITPGPVWTLRNFIHFLKMKIKMKDSLFDTLEKILCPLKKHKHKEGIMDFRGVSSKTSARLIQSKG